MIKFLRKLSLWIISVISIIGYVFADIPDSFSVTMEEKINIWEFADFTVTSIKDWEQLKEYTWTVYFDIYDVNGNTLDRDLFTLPNNSWYDFLETDQWKKIFSKWLQVRKAGTYTILATDLFNDDVVWKAVFEVVWDTGSSSLEVINITYPLNWSIESKPYLTVMWLCENLKNSPVIVYLNEKAAGSGYTDGEWTFEIHTEELLSWDNQIQVKIIDINWVVLWESPIVLVKYQEQWNGDFKLEILPSNTWKQWDKMVFNLTTQDNISVAKLIFSNWLQYSMDRKWQWLFTKELVANFSGDIDISLSLTENSDERLYENIEKISISENIGVSNIQFTATWIDGTMVIVTWEGIWDIPKYQINYGTSKDDLSTYEIVNSSKILVENLNKDNTYFFQIVPMDLESHKSWDPSDIVEYRPATLSCVVKWIKVRKEQIWDNYYLIRDPVENAIAYEVYRSDWADMTDSRLVWSLTGTRFQYLFNPDAEKDEYAYYQVEAICPDWKNVVVDEAQKVKVWPVENMLLVIVISIFVYSLYRLNKISDEN